MKLAHSIEIRVFCGEEESENEVIEGLKWLIPLDLEEQKIRIKRQNALGFGDRKISILEVMLEKEKHVTAFLKELFGRMQGPQKQMLLRQLDSRIDNDANFFIRLEKTIAIKNKGAVVTDGGNCYHVKIKIAAYPSNKGNAMKIARQMIE